MSEQERAVPAPAGGYEHTYQGSGGQPAQAAVPAQPVEQPNVDVPVIQPTVQTAQPAVPTEQVQTPAQPVTQPSTNDLLLKAVGVDGDGLIDAMSKALQHKDVSLIDLSEITKDMTPENAAIVKQIAEAKYGEVQQHINTSVNQVITAAGSQQAWESARDAFNTSAPAHLQSAVGMLFDKGDITSAGQLVLDYARGQGLVNNVQQPQVQGGVGTVQQGLTNAEFKEGLYQLMKEHPNQSLEGNGIAAQKYNQLLSQRQLGKSKGLN